MPRVTIRNIQSFSFLSNSSRLVLQIDVQDASAVQAIAEILLQAKGGRCEVLLRGRLQDGKVVKIRLGRDFAVDAELAARSEEHTSVLQSLMRISYAVVSLKKK